MKLIKLGLISVVVLFLITTLMSALMPSSVLVSRAINIHAPRDSIRTYVQDIHQWKRWIEGMDKPEVTIFSPETADLGGTKVAITQKTDSTILSTWITRSGNEQISTLRMISEPSQGVTIVQWQFVQKVKWYPWEKFGSMMNDKVIGTMMEKNLNTLKVLAESANTP